MHFTATSGDGWGYRIIPTTITDDYVTGTLRGWGPHRGRVVDVPRDAVRTHDGSDMGRPITIYRTNITD